MADNLKTGSDGNVYEMLWDCKFCGTKKLLGKTHRFCPNCGSQQDPSWRYFPSDSEKVAVKDHVYVGADKVCPACQSLSAATAEFCGNCGSPLDKAAAAKMVAERKTAEGQAFTTEDLKTRQQAAQPFKPSAPPKKKGISRTGIILLGIAALVIGGILFTVFSTKTTSISVSGFRWQRDINVDSLQAVSGKSDCNSMPVAAYNVDQRYEQVGSKSVPDGQTCSRKQVDQGDGTFREEQQCTTKYRQEAVYGNVCYYTVNQWSHEKTLTSQGDKTLEVAWPAESLNAGNCLGCEREGSRKETYYLVFKGDNSKAFECPVPVDEWQQTKLEDAFTVKVGTVLKDVRCNTLEKAT